MSIKRNLRPVISTAVGILSAAIVGMVLLWAQGYQLFQSFGALLRYSVFNGKALANTLVRAAPLLLTGLSASVAFRSGAVNLGQLGQLIFGAMMATLCGLWIDGPPIIIVPLLLSVGMVSGGLWAGLAVLLRRRFGMDEFITTLMLNFVAGYFALYLVATVLIDPGLSSTATPPINIGGVLPRITAVPSEFIIALIACALVYVWVHYTTAGYEIKLLGRNSLFTRAGGCDNNGNFARAMLVSGALAGLAGALLISGGQQHRFLPGIGANYGWDGVMIAIVAASEIGATLFYALFFAILQNGSLGMEIETSVPSEFVLVFQAFVVLFVVAARESSHVLLDRIMVRVRSRTVLSSGAVADAQNHTMAAGDMKQNHNKEEQDGRKTAPPAQ